MKRVIKAATDNIYYWNGVDEVPEDVVNVVIEDGVTSIGNGAFSGCENLTSITIPDSVTSIGYDAFLKCVGLTSMAIPGGVTRISDSAFFGCTGLISITIPDSVISIGDYAFWKCESLTSANISDSVTSIGDCAFKGCASLASIVLPASVKYVGACAFYDCRNLKDITILSDPDYFEMDKDAFDWEYLNMKNIKAAPEIKQQIARLPKSSKHTSYKDILSMLDKDLDKYADPLYEDTEAGSYITGLCQEAEERLGIWLEPSIQGGRGGIWIYDSDNNTLAENIDFESFDSDVINIAFRSKSPSDFKRKYTSYLKRLLK